MRKDPLPAFCFHVIMTIPGLENPMVSFFKSVGGIKLETEVVDYRAGGVNGSTYKLVGATKWPNLVLKRGYTGDPVMLAWRATWLSNRALPKIRCITTISQLNTQMIPVPGAQWIFMDCWPCKWEISEFDASKNEVSIETLELAHHGILYG